MGKEGRPLFTAGTQGPRFNLHVRMAHAHQVAKNGTQYTPRVNLFVHYTQYEGVQLDPEIVANILVNMWTM